MAQRATSESASTFLLETTPGLSRSNTARPGLSRPRTATSTIGVENQEIICALSESRGIAPVVGISFVNLDTGEAVLSQINDSQTFVRTIHKLAVFNPSIILIVSSSAEPKSKLFSILEDSLDAIDGEVMLLDRRYWAEMAGLEYIQQLALAEDLDAVMTAVQGNYYAVCCLAAVLKYVELSLFKTFSPHSLRIKYEPAEGCMLVDVSTIRSLELVQNLTDVRSKECLFGHLNQCLTPMGARLLRNNVLQPLTNQDTLTLRYEAVDELSTKEQVFCAIRAALKPIQDADRLLIRLILLTTRPSLHDTEHAINNVILLKQFLKLVLPIYEALAQASSPLLRDIRTLCLPSRLSFVRERIAATINDDTIYANKPLDFRNQRTYAVVSGLNGLLDVARQAYKETTEDAMQHIEAVASETSLPIQTKFDNARRFYMRFHEEDLDNQELPAIFLNVYRKKAWIECQTMDLLKLNQKISDAHAEAIGMSDKAIQALISQVRTHIAPLFKVCEGIALVDMLAGFAQLVTCHEYTQPRLADTLAVQALRHPIRGNIHTARYVPNDVYASQQARFNIVTGCNMSGKSTYIRSIALAAIMAQVGSFVPAQYATMCIRRQLLARVSTDDCIEANLSTFAAEMREAAFILRNVDTQSMVIVDELGRGTSTRDGLAIAIAIAEALIQSRALVWFVTHFRELADVLAERNGVVNLHLAVNNSRPDRMEMLYHVSSGIVEEQQYGIKLASVLPLPPDVISTAQIVSNTIQSSRRRDSSMSLAVITARKRRLLLNLKEHLTNSKDGSMDDSTLSQWLRDLQKEFVLLMSALDDEELQIRSDAGTLTAQQVIQQASVLAACTSSSVHQTDVTRSETSLGDVHNDEGSITGHSAIAAREPSEMLFA